MIAISFCAMVMFFVSLLFTFSCMIHFVGDTAVLLLCKNEMDATEKQEIKNNISESFKLGASGFLVTLISLVGIFTFLGSS